MKKKLSIFILAFVFTVVCGLSATGCVEPVVPCAWVRLEAEGYIVYSSNMYASGGGHIYLYENQEDAEDDKYHSNCALTVTFYPRIMGADTVDGVRTTTVDMANGNYAMNIYVYKNKSVYSPEKKVYLNGEELVASYEDDLEYLVALTFNDFVLVRGNPNGHINGFINVLEYR